nr:hypothetical protein [uncultured Campylobacter sp.]
MLAYLLALFSAENNATKLNATNEIAFGALAIIKAINPANDSCEDECQSSCSDQCRNDDDIGACKDICVSDCLKYQCGK